MVNEVKEYEKGYKWTPFRISYWAFAIIFSIVSLSYLDFYVANVKECHCNAPAPCHADECHLADYYVYTTDSCELACDKLGGFISNVTIQVDKPSFGNISIGG